MFLKIPVILPARKERWLEDVKNGLEMAFANCQSQLKALPVYYHLINNNHQTIIENLDGEAPIVIAAVGTEAYNTLKSHMKDRKFILFTPIASTADLLNDCNNCFRNVPSNKEEAEYMSDFLLKQQEIPVSDIVIFKMDNGSYSNSFAQLLRNNLTGATEVTSIEGIANNKSWIVLVGEEKWKMVEQIRHEKKGIPILTTSSIEDWRQLKVRLELAKDFLFYTYPFTGSNAASFFKDFQKEFGYKPSVVSALGFDAVNIAIDAINRGGRDYRSVRKVLLKDIFGNCIIGETVCFDDEGEVIMSGSTKGVHRGTFNIKTIDKYGKYTIA